MGVKDDFSDFYTYKMGTWKLGDGWTKQANYKRIAAYRGLVKVATVEKPSYTDEVVNFILEEPQKKLALIAIGSITAALNILISGTVRADLYNASDYIHQNSRGAALEVASSASLGLTLSAVAVSGLFSSEWLRFSLKL